MQVTHEEREALALIAHDSGRAAEERNAALAQLAADAAADPDAALQDAAATGL
jgi:hypothetical protein